MVSVKEKPATGEVDVEKQEERKKSADENSLEKVKLKGPPGVNASLILVYGILSSMFIVGWVTLNSCPLNILIPIYLIVAGSTGTVIRVLIHTKNTYLFNLLLAFVLMYIIWHGLGSYWVYKEYQPNYDPIKGQYCDRTAYLLAFWMLTMQYTLVGLVISIASCYKLMKGSFKKI